VSRELGGRERPAGTLKESYTNGARRGFSRLGQRLVRWPVNANALTAAGFTLNVVAAGLIVTGHFIWAAAVFGVAAVCDALDGAVARAGVGATRYGAFFDSFTDRISEMVVYGAIAIHFAMALGSGAVPTSWIQERVWVLREDEVWSLVATLIALGAAQMVSYARARAEAVGVECKVGFMSRPERVVGVALGLVLQPVGLLPFFMWLLAVLTSWTAVRRAVHVLRKLRAEQGGD
jgi:CDP-diacylglycerol---glycerol-3-phosphate 3-phosphatidyltransferase